MYAHIKIKHCNYILELTINFIDHVITSLDGFQVIDHVIYVWPLY